MGLDDAELITGWVARGHGDGRFTADLAPALKGASVYPAIGQLDGGAGVDVMVGQFQDAARIYRWSVAEFTAYRPHQPADPRNHVVADVDSDGRNDVVALCHGAQKFGLTVHRGSSDAAAWTATTTVLGLSTNLRARRPPARPVRRRRRPRRPPVRVRRPARLPARARPARRRVHRARLPGQAPAPLGAVLGDLDEDGRTDILAVEHFPVRLSLVTGDGAGGFEHTSSVDIDAPFTPHALDLDDLDGDGHLDVIAVDAITPLLFYWTGDGHGGFGPAQALELPSGAVRVHAAQLDPDPALDLAVATFDAGEVTILLNPLSL